MADETKKRYIDIPSFSLSISDHLIRDILQAKLPLHLTIDIPVDRVRVASDGSMSTHLEVRRDEVEFSWKLPAKFTTCITEDETPDTVSPPTSPTLAPSATSTPSKVQSQDEEMSPSLLNHRTGPETARDPSPDPPPTRTESYV